MWLARFSDKARLHLRGELTPDFEPFFGRKIATDGAFFAQFDLVLEDALAALRQDDSDAAFAMWFLEQPGVTLPKIVEWNALAPHLGKPGQPMERNFRFARAKYYGGPDTDPRVVSIFTGIAWDEECLDEVPTGP
jgi:hypothetical protein